MSTGLRINNGGRDKEKGLRTKRGRSKTFWGIFVSRRNSLVFQAGHEVVEIFEDQEISFAACLAFGQPYCLEFYPGGTRLKKISRPDFCVIWEEK